MVIVVKNPSAKAGDVGDADWIPGWERSPGGGHGNPLQFSCLENPMDRQRSLVGYSSEGRKESDRTELLNPYTHGGGDNMFKSFKVLLLRQHLSRSTSSREAIVLLLLLLSRFSHVRLCATP